TNVVAELELGDTADVVEEAIARAAHVVARRFRIQRIAGSPIEPRGAVARWDPWTDMLTLWTSSQSPHHVRELLAEVLGLPAQAVRVVAGDAGGAVGNNDPPYPPDVLAS